MQLSCSALAGGTHKSLTQPKCQNLEFLYNIYLCGGECHLAADSAKQDAVALLSHWCSSLTWQDETDRAASI